MLEILMDCHERELMHKEPTNYATQYAKGLLNRGFIDACLYKKAEAQKKYLAFFITESGKSFLQKWSSK